MSATDQRMAKPRGRKDDRLLAREPFRHYRRTYSMAEVRWGFVVLAILVSVAGWVYWKGQHPDPELGAAAIPVGKSGGAASAGNAKGNAKADRGPVPAGLITDGWFEATPAQFTPSNLYVKINGRADYFLGFGFKRLYFVPLRKGEADDATPTVDVEVYDMGSAAGALGAFSGERRASDNTVATPQGMSLQARNSLYLTRGKYYMRVIGSDESAVVKAQLTHLARVLETGMKGVSRPWAYELLVEVLGLRANQVSYFPNNAFSFEFGNDVYSGRLKDDTELFVVVTRDEATAKSLAAKYVTGFEGLGAKVSAAGGVTWIKDRYIGTLATAVAWKRWVVGVRGAPNGKAAAAGLARITVGMDALSDAVKASAAPAPVVKPVDENSGAKDTQDSPDEGSYTGDE